jgi:hypothetical protein
MDLDTARARFEAGELEEAVIEPADEGNGWMLLLRQRDGKLVKLTDHSGVEKVYHSLDHATELAREIGFGQVRVEETF